MSTIVVLGWGSLIVKPAHRPDAPLATTGVRPGLVDEGGSWAPDGPALPLELARTAYTPEGTPYPSWVIAPGVRPSPALYAPLHLPVAIASDFQRAMAASVRALAVREGIDESRVGTWPGPSTAESDTIAAWAASHQIDGVVWTALAPKWLADERAPTEDDVLALVRDLIAKGQASYAEEYIRTTPAQIESPYRRAIERELGWTPA
jgi:hypothetical protein